LPPLLLFSRLLYFFRVWVALSLRRAADLKNTARIPRRNEAAGGTVLGRAACRALCSETRQSSRVIAALFLGRSSGRWVEWMTPKRSAIAHKKSGGKAPMHDGGRFPFRAPTGVARRFILNLGKFRRALDWKLLIHFTAVWNILRA
jgi:hypothetical protein